MTIEINKNICGGEPRIKGTRITVRGVLSCFHSGKGMNEIVRISKKLGNNITELDVKDAVEYSIKNLKNVCKNQG